MAKKLSWNEIKENYPDQWVELVECEWDPYEPDPRNGIVRHHAIRRKQLHELIMKDQPVDDAAVVFAGDVKFKEGIVFNANLHQVIDSK